MVMDHFSSEMLGHVAFAILGGVVGLIIGLTVDTRKWFGRS